MCKSTPNFTPHLLTSCTHYLIKGITTVIVGIGNNVVYKPLLGGKGKLVNNEGVGANFVVKPTKLRQEKVVGQQYNTLKAISPQTGSPSLRTSLMAAK